MSALTTSASLSVELTDEVNRRAKVIVHIEDISFPFCRKK